MTSWALTFNLEGEREMRRNMQICAAGLLFLFFSASLAVAQPSPEEAVNVFASVRSSSNQMDVSVFTVPAGKQLIIEYVSLRALVPAGETVNSAFLNTPHVHFFVVANQGRDISNQDVFTAAQSVRIVVEAGQTIRFRAERNNFGTTGFLTGTVAGTLVRTP
jgi:hypothetical protein